MAGTAAALPSGRQGVVLVVMFALLALIMPFGSMGIAALVLFAAVAAMPFRGWTRPHAMTGAVCLLLVWAWVSSIWSIAPMRADVWRDFEALQTFTAFKLALMLTIGIVLIQAAGRLTDPWQGRVRTAFLWMMAISGSILMLEGLGEAQLFDRLTRLIEEQHDLGWRMRAVGQGGFVFVLLLWPALYMFVRRRRYRIALGLGLLALMIVPLFGRDAQVLALGVGGTIAVGGLVAGPLFSRAVPVVAAFSMALILPVMWGLPWLMQRLDIPASAIPPSWAMRLEIWQFAASKAAGHPVLGLGLDASRAFPQKVMVAGLEMPQIPLHPHNMALQLWLELGAVGACLMALAFMALAALMRDLPRGLNAMVAASFATWFTIASLSFGVWQEWWIASAIIAIIALRLAAMTPQRDTPWL